MNSFLISAIDVLESNGFAVKIENHEPVKLQHIIHNAIPNLMVKFRVNNDRNYQLEIIGRTIQSSRVIDYFDHNPTQIITNLKSRFARVMKKEYERMENDNNKLVEAVNYKKEIANVIKEFNTFRESINPCHSVVVDDDYMDDSYKVLICYYRGYEFEVKMDANGDVYIFQSLFNTPRKQLSISQVVGIIDILV